MMNQQVCGDHALLQSFAEGTLASEEARAVKAHVTSCAACRAAVRDYKQIMWDLERPPEVELPPELARSYDALMEAWRKEHKKSAAQAKGRGSLVPSWAAYSVSWTRNLPAAGMVGSLVRRTGGALVDRALPRWLRRKGGERH